MIRLSMRENATEYAMNAIMKNWMETYMCGEESASFL